MNDFYPHPAVCQCEICQWRRTERLMVDLDWFYFHRMVSEQVSKERARAN